MAYQVQLVLKMIRTTDSNMKIMIQMIFGIKQIW